MQDEIITYDQEVFRKYMTAENWEKIVSFDSINAMWAHCAKDYADAPAIMDDGKTYTFADIDADIAKVRGCLQAAGIKKGDLVGVYSPNSYGFVRCYLAAVTLGAIAVLLPQQLDEMTIFGISHMMKLRVICAGAPIKAKTNMAAEKLGVCVLDAETCAAEPCAMAECGAKDPCVILFTGGTTGKSKGALLAHGAILRGTMNGCYGYETVFGQRYLEILPLTHVFGLIRNLMTSLYTGSCMYICRNNKDMFRDAAMFRPTMLVMVPALAEMALNLSKKFGRNMLGDSVRYIICGAATVPPYLAKEYEKLGIKLLAGYGLTESANLVTGNPKTLEKPTSVGFPFPGQELRIVDGELWLKGVNMMIGYVGNPQENAAAYTDGWFRTGDLVRVDEEGMIYITGRTKEILVLPNGENISPAEVEQKFNDAIEAIQDSLVYIDHDAAGGEILALQVYPRLTVLGTVDAEDKNAWLRARISEVNMTLPAFSRVSKVIIRDTDFERSPAMKILRNKNAAQ